MAASFIPLTLIIVAEIEGGLRRPAVSLIVAIKLRSKIMPIRTKAHRV
jgi:hypothetical protein